MMINAAAAAGDDVDDDDDNDSNNYRISGANGSISGSTIDEAITTE